MQSSVLHNDIALIRRLREKCKGNEAALDALLYYILSENGATSVESVIKRAMTFFATPDGEGEALYAEVLALSEKEDEGEGKSPDAYEQTRRWVMTLGHKNEEE
jgi:hypothetical protein